MAVGKGGREVGGRFSQVKQLTPLVYLDGAFLSLSNVPALYNGSLDPSDPAPK